MIDNPNKKINYAGRQLNKIYLAGGCFWGVDAFLSHIEGVRSTLCGYANGFAENPTYEQVCTGNTGFCEAVEIVYAPGILPLESLLEHFFGIIDPTSLNRQGGDIGSQYRTGVYPVDEKSLNAATEFIEGKRKDFDKPIVTELMPLKNFFPAEDYHQDYLIKNPNGYCHINLDNIPAPTGTFSYDKNLKDVLSNISYEVTQNSATERPFTGEYDNHYEPGIYVDIVSGDPLFASVDKYDAGCGWPAFSRPIDESLLTRHEDLSHGRVRTEVRSAHANSHLGHVFEDGPKDSGGLRFCINSAALRFIHKDNLVANGFERYLVLFED